jgi:hypothetical protein
LSAKKDMIAEIEKKAQKIRNKRVDAANNKNLEAAVFDFFRNAEESRKIHNGERYDHTLMNEARRSLQERISGFDRGSKISIEFNVSDEHKSWQEQQIRGVTIWWSKAYIIANKVDPSYFIDISQMLFL